VGLRANLEFWRKKILLSLPGTERQSLACPARSVVTILTEYAFEIKIDVLESMKWDVGLWTGVSWLRIQRGGGHLCMR